MWERHLAANIVDFWKDYRGKMPLPQSAIILILGKTRKLSINLDRRRGTGLQGFKRSFAITLNPTFSILSASAIHSVRGRWFLGLYMNP